jgi:hypothetical protein
VTQNKDLQILGGVVIGEQGEELDRAAQRQVGEAWQHLGAAATAERILRTPMAVWRR